MSGAPVRVLLAEDEEHLGTILETFLAARGVRVERARDGRAALARLQAECFDVALLDVVMPELDGIEVLRSLAALPAPPEAIIMTGNGTADTALAALAAGAYDYIAKPYRMAEIELLVRRAAEKFALRRRGALQRRALDAGRQALVGRAPAFLAALAETRAAAAEHADLLLLGERGTGRRALARWSGEGCGPAGTPLVVRCDAPADVLRAALFGGAPHAPPTGSTSASAPAGAGAAAANDAATAVWTAARDAQALAGDPRLGALELAAGDTLVLAELHTMPAPIAGELAEALERRGFRRGGCGTPVPLTARLVATAHDALADGAAEHARLAALLGRRRAVLPPLRERVVDIRLLAEHIVGGLDAVLRLDADVVPALERYAWPGNVAELRRVLAVAGVRTVDGVLRRGDLPLPADAAGRGTDDGDHAARTALPLAELERQQILAVLAAEGWHRGRAASRLGISPRTLYRKLRTFGVTAARA